MILSRREAEVVAAMKALDEELIYERGRAFLGARPVAARVVFSLLRKMLIANADYSGKPGECEYFRLNSDAVDSLADHWGVEARTIEITEEVLRGCAVKEPHPDTAGMTPEAAE